MARVVAIVNQNANTAGLSVLIKKPETSSRTWVPA